MMPTSDIEPTQGYTHYPPDVIRAAVGFEDVTESVGRAFVDRSRGLGDSPVAVIAPKGAEGDVHIKSAWLPGREIFTVKVATWFAARTVDGRSPSAGIVAAFDARTGDLRALLEDDHHISDIRTAAAGALATRALARPDAATLAVLGTGVQAYLQALAAVSERPVREVRVWGRNSSHADRLARAVRRRCPGLHVLVASTPEDAVRGTDILVTATASREPLVEAAWLTPGVHITAVGADDPGKCELAPGCFARADRIVVDSSDLTRKYGDIRRAIAAGVLAPDHRFTELGELIADASLGRAAPDEITVCKLIGLGVQDLAAAEVTLALLESDVVPSHPPASVLDLA